jgi:hypothetical protein
VPVKAPGLDLVTNRSSDWSTVPLILTSAMALENTPDKHNKPMLLFMNLF